MGEGELYRRMKISLAELPFDEHYEKGAKRHLDEAKKDFPLSRKLGKALIVPDMPHNNDEIVQVSAKKHIESFETIMKWFEKWFGDSS